MQDRTDRVGQFARLAADLVIAEAGIARQAGNAHRLEDLARFERDVEDAGDEALDRHPARTGWPAQDHLGADGRQARRPVGGGIGMGEAPADRAARTHRPVGDAARNVAKCAAGHVRHAPVLEVGMRDAGADDDRVVAHVDALELGNPRNVHEHIGLRKTEVEHRHERLAAGQNLHGEVLAAIERNCTREVRGALVRKARRLHA